MTPDNQYAQWTAETADGRIHVLPISHHEDMLIQALSAALLALLQAPERQSEMATSTDDVPSVMSAARRFVSMADVRILNQSADPRNDMHRLEFELALPLPPIVVSRQSFHAREIVERMVATVAYMLERPSPQRMVVDRLFGLLARSMRGGVR